MAIDLPVPGSLDGERIDRAVALLCGWSRAEVAAAISSNAVALNGKVVAVRHRRVAAGEQLVVSDVGELFDKRSKPSSAVPFHVVFDDDQLIVVDKPAGVVVHPGAGHRDDTLVSGLLSRYPELEGLRGEMADGPDRPGIVHRLDKQTSGLLVVARTKDALVSLTAQLREHSTRREYLALVLGNFESDAGRIEAPIGRSDRSRTRMAVRSGGREATTNYLVKKRFATPVVCSLLEVQLETGRTHQIRVHLAAIGHPVAGDARYGGRVAGLALDRPFLHASHLELTHPRTGDRLAFDAPLPPELISVLEALTEVAARS